MDMEQLIHDSDFLSLHVPLLDETRHMVDGDFLSRMKQGAYLINAARGELIDQEALLTALDSGPVSYTHLDVYKRQIYIS